MRHFLFGLLILSFINTAAQSEKKKFTYFQFDIAASITGNPDINEPDDQYGSHNNAWLVPDGLGSKIGYGIQYKKWITLGLHTGIDYKWNDKLVAVPVYLNFGLSPKVGLETRITVQAGYGKGFALGRGDLNGLYRKLRLGIGSDEFTIFVETSQYDFRLYDQKNIQNISLGVSIISF
ncbi:hypothetical protein EV144_10790 [Flavobacterium sp. 270]|uniref:hypothetical protein n=1 Tax=Flavobacterium sp. 270 TaxID=2512114 RepID=UPI0010660AB7|nr:hypothetical protein [Flavobacterium sp. 270]TDW45899.1 hypothetical protein EV144_10790 [Flavobacterium sp. 270]